MKLQALAPGELFAEISDIQARLVPTVSILAKRNGNGGCIIFSEVMSSEKIQMLYDSRMAENPLEGLMIVGYSHDADPRCYQRRKEKKMPETNLCAGCNSLFNAQMKSASK